MKSLGRTEESFPSVDRGVVGKGKGGRGGERERERSNS